MPDPSRIELIQFFVAEFWPRWLPMLPKFDALKTSISLTAFWTRECAGKVEETDAEVMLTAQYVKTCLEKASNERISLT